MNNNYNGMSVTVKRWEMQWRVSECKLLFLQPQQFNLLNVAINNGQSKQI